MLDSENKSIQDIDNPEYVCVFSPFFPMEKKDLIIKCS